MERGKNPRAGHWEALLERDRSDTWKLEAVFLPAPWNAFVYVCIGSGLQTYFRLMSEIMY